MQIPSTYQDLKNHWKAHQSQLIEQYTSNTTSFIPDLLPENAVQLSISIFNFQTA